ncbi:hypothetical protein BDW02DRAFT_648428 [Decorospora gaudefroyi]|uniref:Cell wall proline rich protein n=1 Tax=Decorospora gaudefroyi TaxID=184978 RepID=A0A6A5KA35_9PLEO|nr:hypothetical protein BDW02DRAFT_648428 [Decorospora gaudefroyi]
MFMSRGRGGEDWSGRWHVQVQGARTGKDAGSALLQARNEEETRTSPRTGVKATRARDPCPSCGACASVRTSWEGTTDKSAGCPAVVNPLTHSALTTVNSSPAAARLAPPSRLSFIDIFLEPIVALTLTETTLGICPLISPRHSLILGVLASLRPTTATAAYRLPIIASSTTYAILTPTPASSVRILSSRIWQAVPATHQTSLTCSSSPLLRVRWRYPRPISSKPHRQTLTMAQIALPRHQATQSQSGVGSPLYQRRQHSNAGPIELIPNPDFSFPMKDPDTLPSEPAPSSSRPMSLQAYPTGRRGSMPHYRQKSINTLPDFSFNPAGAAKPSLETSPPQSPSTLPVPITPTKPTAHGHRRGGSEFIGGDVRPGGSALMSTSPTKGDDVLPPPSSTLRPGPPAGRRGHAHRRSGAISSHDLSSIMNPPAPARCGSAPSTPSEGNQFAFGHKFNRSVSQPSLRESGSDDDSSARPPSRARVTFSDRIETIRPLSTISSGTETSMSTVRGHSAANSLSSIVSSSSPQPARTGRPSLNTVEDEDRPSTAGMVLDRFMSSCLNGEVSERKRPMSAISPVSPTAPPPQVQAKRRSLFQKDSRRNVPSLPTSISDPALSKSFDLPLASPMTIEPQSSDETEKPKAAPRKSSRKPRKVKSWANSIITRKGKYSKKSKARAPTPPPNKALDAEDSDESEEIDFEPNFDDDTTVTIVSPSDSSVTRPKIDTNYASWQPRQLQRVDSDIMSPVIDLDAALGPFNTPNGTSPRNHQRGFSAHRRAMHSATGIAPTHRRTESAPELVPFEHRSSAVAAASPMADVFEEEEPEDDLGLPTKDARPESVVEEAEEPKISIVEADGKQEGSAINWNFGDGLGINRPARGDEVDPAEPLSPRAIPPHVPSESVLQRPQQSDSVEVVEDHEEPRTSSLTHSSDSTVTPQPSEDSPKQHQTVMNLSLPLPEKSLMTPDTVTSSFSSPDYRSSQISFDTGRGGTAASSMTDYPVMPSPRFGEPGPEVRISTDVPSLTSSRSTMTSAMQNACPPIGPRRFGDRTASLCSDPSDLESRRRKRSSIASLSRLMGNSSYSERSKLSIEQRPQSEHQEPSKDKKKKNIGSRLKGFFKHSKEPKDSPPSKT